MTQAVGYDSIVVGAGFAGLYMLHKLRALGHRSLVLEKGDGVGGTWYWNRYPGARCDVASMEYSYQFDEQLQQEWNWSELYSPQAEILRYANHVADRFDLRRDIRFTAQVTAAAWDDTASAWRITTADGTDYTARYLIAATGCLSSPNRPQFRGISDFKGDIYHTGNWPHEPVNFSGSKVAIIGTGSSAIQAIPVIAQQARQLTVFQRSANYAVPAHNAPLPTEERDRIKMNYAELRQQAAQTRNGQATPPNPKSAMQVSESERQQTYQTRWQRGGLAFMGSFNDLIVNAESNTSAADFVRTKIQRIVHDKQTAQLLSPTTPIGCKRLCVDTGYYDTFNRGNVALVDLKKQPIESVTQTGLQVEGKELAFDALVFATGFDAMTGSLLRMNISGRDGKALADSWEEGPRNFLGLACNAYPNLFTITGPGSPSVLTNMLPSIEQHVNLIGELLKHAQSQHATLIEADLPAQESWVARVNEIASKTIYPGCNSWYLGANVAGKPRVFMPFIGFADYVKICEQFVADDFKGFSFS
jgi:cyclohexanone monooxygenase